MDARVHTWHTIFYMYTPRRAVCDPEGMARAHTGAHVVLRVCESGFLSPTTHPAEIGRAHV